MQIREEVSLFEQLIEALPFGVYVLGVDNIVRHWNRAAELISGYLSQEIRGRQLPDGFVVRSAQSVGADVAIRPAHDGCVENRVFLKHKEGHHLSVVLRLVPLQDAQGGIAATAHLFQEEAHHSEGVFWIAEDEARFDPVMGAYSGATSEKQLRCALASGSEFAAYLIEIIGIDELTKRHGTEMTNTAIRTVIHSITRTVTVPYYLGLWGRSLLVLVPGGSSLGNVSLQNRIAAVCESCAIRWWGDQIQLRIGVASTVSQTGDSVASIIGRLHGSVSEGPQESTTCS